MSIIGGFLRAHEGAVSRFDALTATLGGLFVRIIAYRIPPPARTRPRHTHLPSHAAVRSIYIPPVAGCSPPALGLLSPCNENFGFRPQIKSEMWGAILGGSGGYKATESGGVTQFPAFWMGGVTSQVVWALEVGLGVGGD